MRNSAKRGRHARCHYSWWWHQFRNTIRITLNHSRLVVSQCFPLQLWRDDMSINVENRDRFSVLPTESTACNSSMYCLGKFDRNTERCTVCCAVGSAMLCSKAWTVCTARAPRPERPKSPKDWLFSDHFGLFRTISNDSWTQAAQPSRINATWPKEEICLHIFQIEGNR